MRIPEEVIENIRQEANILDVVSKYVQMKKRGKNHFGFSEERNHNQRGTRYVAPRPL